MMETKMERTIRLAGVLWAAALSLLLFASATPLLAADQNPCADDIQKYCKGVGRNKSNVLKCLEEHETLLSDACKDYEAALEKTRAEAREPVMRQMRIRQACPKEVLTFCNNVQFGQGGLVGCLAEHKTELSAPCSDAIKGAGDPREEEKGK
jgi:hypothetical protein